MLEGFSLLRKSPADDMQNAQSASKSYASSELWKFLSLGYALMLCPFIIVLGGMFFLATALFFLDDREKAEQFFSALLLTFILLLEFDMLLKPHFQKPVMSRNMTLSEPTESPSQLNVLHSRHCVFQPTVCIRAAS
ncbi:hypothetical protein GOODEAATRI_000371 [Goodea atripinnis]|uniref:Adenosine A3 receptor n=1 Tax=Goodea atripinnis TaxID=208336 RepID=A0ABV0PU72_9TELE